MELPSRWLQNMIYLCPELVYLGIHGCSTWRPTDYLVLSRVPLFNLRILDCMDNCKFTQASYDDMIWPAGLLQHILTLPFLELLRAERIIRFPGGMDRHESSSSSLSKVKHWLNCRVVNKSKRATLEDLWPIGLHPPIVRDDSWIPDTSTDYTNGPFPRDFE